MVINENAFLDTSQIEDMRESTAASLVDVPEPEEKPEEEDKEESEDDK